MREKGVVAWLPPTTSFSPVGSAWKLNSTVCGSSRTLSVSVKPARVSSGQAELQVRRVLVVRRDERAAGHTGEVLHGCSWQFRHGQWCRTSDQDSVEAGSVPSCWSLAEPEKEILSPTFQVVVEGGVSMVAVGGVLPALILSGSSKVSVAPWLSVTLRPTW